MARTPPPFSSIPLVHLYSEADSTTPSLLDSKDPYSISPPSTGKTAEFPHDLSDPLPLEVRSVTSETVRPRRSRTSRRSIIRWTWGWDTVETVGWAAIPPLLFVVGVALLCAAMFTKTPNRAYLSIVEQNGTGRLDYYIFQACAVASGSTVRACTAPSVRVDFVPALTTVSPSLLGFSALQLPFRSDQTPSIFLSSLVFLVVSALLYAPLWTLAYFPAARLPSPVVRLARYSAATLFELSGFCALFSFLFTLTIGVGVLLQSQQTSATFAAAYSYGALASPATIAQVTNPAWVPQVGGGFALVWAACTFSGLLVLAIKVNLHCGMDEKVEWPADDKTVLPGGA